jgi:hypothetical protein
VDGLFRLFRLPAPRSLLPKKKNGRLEWGGIPAAHMYSAEILERAAE